MPPNRITARKESDAALYRAASRLSRARFSRKEARLHPALDGPVRISPRTSRRGTREAVGSSSSSTRSLTLLSGVLLARRAGWKRLRANANGSG